VRLLSRVAKINPSETLAIAAKLKRDNDLEYKRSQIVFPCAEEHTLYNLAQVLFNPGDEIIIPVL
jgi:aspartate aminotransferase